MIRRAVLALCAALVLSGPVAVVPAASAAPHSTAKAKKRGHGKKKPKRKPATARPKPAPSTAPAAAQAPLTTVTHEIPAPNPPAPLGPCADAALAPSAANLDRARAALLCLINQERARQGVGALRANDTLLAAADTKAADMVARNFFAHTSPTGQSFGDLLRDVGYAVPGKAFDVGENLAWAQGSLATPAQVVAGWMGSAGHRANILDPRFRESGFGVVAAVPASVIGGLAKFAGVTVVEEFGAREG